MVANNPPRTDTVHVHHWVIAAPDSAQSEGICKLCGERRMFSNEPVKHTFAAA